MIRAICLNPAIDRVYMIDSFQAGKQYRGNSPTLYVGGKGINVARACALLGAGVAVYGFIGGVNGQLVLKEIERCGCDNRFVHVEGETRVTINVIDNTSKKETEIIERGDPVTQAEIEKLLTMLARDMLKDDLVICSGISIAGTQTNIYRTISELCQQAGAKCLLDTNGEYLQQAIGGSYYLFKPNRNELLGLFKAEDTHNLQAIIAYARKALGKNMDNILVSLGKKGAIFLTENVCYRAEVPEIRVGSTIGCGDSTVAGFAVGIAQGLSKLEALRLAVACGVANAGSEGICDFSLQDLEKYRSEVKVHPIFSKEEDQYGT